MDATHTENAPASGPLSQATRDVCRIYASRQGRIDPDTDEIVDGGVESQAKRTLKNVQAVLAMAKCSLADMMNTSIFVRNVTDYDAIDEVYDEFVSEPYPARSAIEVADHPVDIGAIASACGDGD